METLDAHGKAMELFDAQVRRIGRDQWTTQTPCADWHVRDLLTHLVSEQLWVPHLLSGGTIAEAGDRFDGDAVLGDHPARAWHEAATAARRAWLAEGAIDGEVEVSFGRTDAVEYCLQMTVDLAVHGWDLATALGHDQPISGDLAEALLDFVAPQASTWESTPMFAAPVPVPADTPAADRLVAVLGRDPGR